MTYGNSTKKDNRMKRISFVVLTTLLVLALLATPVFANNCGNGDSNGQGEGCEVSLSSYSEYGFIQRPVGYEFGANYYLAQPFTLNKTVAVTSVQAKLTGTGVFNVDILPAASNGFPDLNNRIYRFTVNIAGSIANDSLPVNGTVVLKPGNYFIGFSVVSSGVNGSVLQSQNYPENNSVGSIPDEFWESTTGGNGSWIVRIIQSGYDALAITINGSVIHGK